MKETIQRKLNDSAFARWTALVLIALMMLFGYMFVDLLSPLQSMIEVQRGWTPDVFGLYGGSEFIFNVLGFLIIAGIILDKMGIRFTGELSASLMFIGACIKYYAVSDYFIGTGLETWLNSWWISMPGSAKLACLGFMIFGCGTEMAGVTVSKSIAKWFAGKEMALAMGLEMAIARLGVFTIFSISPMIANIAPVDVARPIAFCALLLLIGLLFFSIFCIMDRKLDKQLGADASIEPEEPFKVSDIGNILSSKVFWIIAMLCVLYYSAIFPFQRFATNMLESNLKISAETASDIFRWFPMGAAAITPFLGHYLDKKGKGATMLIFGAMLMIVCHLTFAFILPAFPSTLVAYGAIILLGISFSLVPAALWPSIPKIMETRYLGSAYSLIFWIQNIGLCIFPLLIGFALKITNPGVAEQIKAGVPGVAYNYTVPMLIFASCGVVALFLGILLKREDAKKGYGLELPNVKE
ncbi:MAG: MFS transporter [Alistipes sp.]